MTAVEERRIDVASPRLAAGEAQASTAAGSLTDSIIAALRTVQDPEIPVNIYDLGLIYRIAPQGQGLVDIDMTLTAPGCPVAGEILKWVEQAVIAVEGVDTVNVRLVFDPPWDKSMMSEDIQLELGLI
jgi:FeS assembly SUF system protein